jgi:transcriptional regulator with XRE-family HTH domain
MLGDELRKARQDAEMSQEKVALQAGVDRSYLSELENNKWSPTVEMLVRICDALKVDASEIIARVERQRRKG